MILVLGGSGSGKSAFAEKRIKEISDRKKLSMHYIATMKVYGAEEEKIVLRHRQLREGKNFITIEQPVDLEKCIQKINEKKGGCEAEEKGVSALLECMSNLTANEMFADDRIVPEDQVVTKICSHVNSLRSHLEEFVIVSNNIFDDGVPYDETTLSYIRALGRINAYLAEQADEVWETVVGIPVRIK